MVLRRRVLPVPGDAPVAGDAPVGGDVPVVAIVPVADVIPVVDVGAPPARRWGSGQVGLAVGVFFIAMYGGYFGAAAGVILLAALLLATTDSLAQASAAKNLILGVANGLAAVLFVVASSVRWSAAIPLAVGLLIGGRAGPVVTRRSPARPLQLLIAAGGLGLAVYLGLQAYG